MLEDSTGVMLHWEAVPSNDREWRYARARVPGGWLVRGERNEELNPNSAMLTFVPDPTDAWQNGQLQDIHLTPPAPPRAEIVRFLPGAEAKVRFVPHNVRKVIALIDGVRTIEEIVQQCGIKENDARKIIRELINHNILEER